MARGNRQVLRLRGRAFLRNRSGTIAVEFAYMMPVFLVTLMCLGEVALAISDQMSVQAAARAGTHYGLQKPPAQGDVAPVIAAVEAAMPARWISGDDGGKPVIAAAVLCECEFTGPVQCGSACAKGERSQSFLKVDVTKVHKSILSFQGLKAQLSLKNTSMVRLQ